MRVGELIYRCQELRTIGNLTVAFLGLSRLAVSHTIPGVLICMIPVPRSSTTPAFGT